MATHWKILIAILVGATAGLLAHQLEGEAGQTVGWITDNVTWTVGELWLRGLKMLAIPMIFAALVIGVAELDTKKLGRVGLKTLAYTVGVSVVAVAIGMAFVNVFQPGESDAPALRELAHALAEKRDVIKAPTQGGAEMIAALIPDNPFKAAANTDMIGVLVFALFVGVGATLVRTPATQRFVEVIQGLYEIVMKLVTMWIKLAPIGVAALIFTTMARLGIEILPNIALYVVVVLGALGAHLLLVYPALLWFMARRSPVGFFRDSRLAMGTAFATASSNATLPTSLEVADQALKLPRGIARFVLTAGSTMNQHGTALFEGVTVLFLAQLFEVDLSIGQQLGVMFICVLGGVGTAGIPAGSLPVVAMILAMYGIPPEGLALVMGVDRFLDMCRTTLNVTGDLVVACCVAHEEEDLAHEPGAEPGPG
ncbi:MAG: dicarboxylate/amino acid:cation symporter [Deltaproteobacteria bacterium]|nr:dicarboxylate/amino acid:cation symporter [Deltaproteobacteria bacterium]